MRDLAFSEGLSKGSVRTPHIRNSYQLVSIIDRRRKAEAVSSQSHARVSSLVRSRFEGSELACISSNHFILPEYC